MIKTLIATGLITTNIMGAVVNKSNDYQLYYSQGNYIQISNSRKYKYTEEERINNDVIDIRIRTYFEYTHIKGSTGQYQNYELYELQAFNYIWVNPKGDVTTINLHIESGNPPINLENGQMEYTANQTSMIAYKMEIGSTAQENILTTFFTSQTRNAQNLSDIEDLAILGTRYELYNTSSYNMVEKFSNPSPLIDEPNSVEMLYMYRMYLTKETTDYINNPIEEPWTDTDNFFMGTPTRIYGSYNWAQTMPDTVEVIDIPGLLFEILGMPFAFISYAFNLTIFPGTPYQLNLTHIFLALIVSGIIIFIIKKVYK